MRIENYDVIVIGGGVLGCFAARSMARYALPLDQSATADNQNTKPLKIALLEKREDICTGISRANTAIVYSGCDTKPGTMKTAMCVRAAQDFAALCEELGVRYSPCGSIMVCFGERGASVLRKKYRDGIENGVRGVKLLTRDEVLQLEPNISENVHSGLFVPDTGTVMPWELCLAAAENAVGNGVEILLNAEVTGIERKGSGGFIIRAGDRAYSARCIVNCAGLSADRIHETVSEPTVRIVPTAGDYFILDTKASGHIKHVIFHEPEEKGKGLTLVPTVDGNILIGPTERPLAQSAWSAQGSGNGQLTMDNEQLISGEFTEESVGRWLAPAAKPAFPVGRPTPAAKPASPVGRPAPAACSEYGFETEHEGMDLLRELTAEVIPTLSLDHIIRSFGAIRPNPYMLERANSAQGPDNGQWTMDNEQLNRGELSVSLGESVNDFCIVEAGDGAFISLIGVKTPGLTCANELGIYVSGKIAALLGAVRKEERDVRGAQESGVRLNEMPFDEREAFVRENPDYGRIICRCRGISEGEIKDAIRRFPGAVTTDGVKRRTGAGSGRCQGGFCGQSVAELLRGNADCAQSAQGSGKTPGPTGHPLSRKRAEDRSSESDSQLSVLNSVPLFTIFKQTRHSGLDPEPPAVSATHGIPSQVRDDATRFLEGLNSQLINDYDIIVIGGGPAGMAAAIVAASGDGQLNGGDNSQFSIRSAHFSNSQFNDALQVLLIERAPVLGGILNQCTHTGFGLTFFGEELTGQEYSRRFVERIESSQVEVLTDTMVIDVSADRIVTVSGKKTGLARVRAKAVILASGCRERPIGALPVAGTRPAGVYAAGAAQKMINLGGYDLGNRFVILGSGDVGLIVARELAKRGKEVIAVIEKEDKCGGLPRNRINCLERYGIPLMTNATVSRVHGIGRISGVTVTNARDQRSDNGQRTMGNGQLYSGESREESVGNPAPAAKPTSPVGRPTPAARDQRPDNGQRTMDNGQLCSEESRKLEDEKNSQFSILNSQFIECDTLITSVGLIPERELLDSFAGDLPDWLFLCGNACYVHDVVDDVSEESERAGRFAAEYVLRSGFIDQKSGECSEESVGRPAPAARRAQGSGVRDQGSGNEQLTIDNGQLYSGECSEERRELSVGKTPAPTGRPLSRKRAEDACDSEICVGCPKGCVVSLTDDGWQGLACGRAVPIIN